MERKTKGQVVQIVIIIILAVLLVVSLGLGATFAWFSNQNQADVTMTMGGKILIKLENSDTEEGGSKTATFVNRKDLLPGMNVESDVNILISQSNTPCFLRAKIDTTVTPKDNTFQLSANSKQQIINTFNDGIQKVIDKTGVLYVKSSDLTGGPGYGNTITAGVRWILYDGWFYLVTVDQDMSATEPEDINLLNVYTGESDLLLPFVVGDFNLPGEEWGNDLKDCDITFDITAQAVQIFQTKKVGDERYTYHNETLDEALVVFGEALDPRIEFYANGGTGTKPDTIFPDVIYPPDGFVDDDSTLVMGEYITVPTADLKYGSKNFKCWNTRADGRGTNYYAGDKIKLTPARKRLYAVYE